MFQDATNSYDPRSVEDKRIQPWRRWWPYKAREGDEHADNNRQPASPVLRAPSGEVPPWLKWEFNNDQPWEKPWIYWPLSWSPKYYGHAFVEPEVMHVEAFIAKCLALQDRHPISDFNPFRTTSLVQFFKEKPGHEHEKAYALRVPVSPDSGVQSNFEGAWSQVMLTDARGHEDLFTLDRDGFAWFTHTSKVPILDPGTDVVHAFDVHAYMRSMSEYLCQLLGADNLWRPLLPVIEAYPLAACTYTSTAHEDLVPIDVVYPHYAEESFEIRHKLTHQWFYKSQMTPKDIMLIKLFDNKMEGNTAYYSPHGSWRDPNARKDAPFRRSIELRCMVFG
ncbi:hypothetical protein BJX64DRAFT_291390 [Aspergillus heterothallicus]